MAILYVGIDLAKNVFAVRGVDEHGKPWECLIDLNTDHVLRYIRTGYRLFPSWAVVEPFAVRLHLSLIHISEPTRPY